MGTIGFWIWLAGLAALHFAGLGVWVAAQKGRRPAEGAILGFFYGPVGVIVLALLPRGRTRPAEAVRDPRTAPDDLPWLDEFGSPRETPSEVAWLNDLEERARR